MKRNPVTLVTAGLIAIIFAAMLFAFQVRQTEVVAVTTLGKYSRTVSQPGFKLRLPWPIQNVYRFDNRTHNFEKKYEQTTTTDGRIIMIEAFIGWRIKDARIFLERFGGDVARAEQSLEGLLRDAKNSTVGRHPFSDFISPNREELHFDDIEQEMLAAIKDKAADTYGIGIDLLGIKQIGLTESLTQKVFDRMKAEREQLVRQYRADGERRAQDIRSAADKEMADILSAAESRARVIRGEAEASAAKALKTFEQDPELAVFLIKLDTLEAALKEKATLVLDPRTPPFDLLQGEGSTKPSQH
ncbi:MAG: protease modulator HflC [Verrucomicrobiales bacterium]|nr:protease modulator HflC [Verrucomicrobiales bacterium]